jgi:hypothetical protein
MYTTLILSKNSRVATRYMQVIQQTLYRSGGYRTHPIVKPRLVLPHGDRKKSLGTLFADIVYSIIQFYNTGHTNGRNLNNIY